MPRLYSEACSWRSSGIRFRSKCSNHEILRKWCLWRRLGWFGSSSGSYIHTQSFPRNRYFVLLYRLVLQCLQKFLDHCWAAFRHAALVFSWPGVAENTPSLSWPNQRSQTEAMGRNHFCMSAMVNVHHLGWSGAEYFWHWTQLSKEEGQDQWMSYCGGMKRDNVAGASRSLG